MIASLSAGRARQLDPSSRRHVRNADPLSPHPHFDDRGTLRWHTRWAGALAQAQAERKKLFIEFGRELCGQCRTLVQAVVPHPDIAPRLQRDFVALASDCDDAEPEVLELAERLEDASMLPFVIFADEQGRFLAGASGAQSPASFARLLDRLESADAP
jgi:thioredoxin-related protein